MFRHFTITCCLTACILSFPARSAMTADTPAITSESISCATPTGTLHGTLTIPAVTGPVPCAIIIAGSGPTDRDGNSAALPGKNDSLAMLAEGLAARGIASIRYDKRGVGESASAAAGGEAALRFDTYVDDAVLWAGVARHDPRFSRLLFIGHSEGSLIGMLAARTAEAEAFVSIAGVGRRADAVILEQLRGQAPPAMLAQASATLKSLVAGETTDDYPPELVSLFRPSVQPYMISWLRYDPTVEMAKLNVPVLVAQGTTDIQVSVGDAELLMGAARHGTKLVVDGMNHVLKTVPADRARQLASYSDPTRPVTPGLVDGIARFIHVTPSSTGE